jgi:alkylhydroperoxidase family enzyme
MDYRYTTHIRALIDAVLNSPGETDPQLRHAVEAQSAQLSGHPSQHEADSIPQELAPYIKKVALHAYKTTDKDIEALRALGYSEDQLFELTLSAALGAGMVRLKCGLAALKGGQDASSEA